MMVRFMTLLLGLFAGGTTAFAVVLHVPAEFSTIQAAIEAASFAGGDVVLVAPGTYFETISFSGKPVVVRSADGPAVTVIDGSLASNQSVVSFILNESSGSVLEGFTVTGGTGFLGAGIVIDDGSPTIRGNIISGNEAYECGGGIYVFGGGTIDGNVIESNLSGDGGGIYAVPFGPDELIIQNNTIRDNVVFQSGLSRGGGILLNQGEAVVVNNLIQGNHVSGIAASGGGVAVFGTDVFFENNTVAENFAADQAGGLAVFSLPEFTMRNCIFWGNESPLDPEIPTPFPAFVWDVSYSVVTGGFVGVGNLDADPLLMSGPRGDGYLNFASPCIDSADPATPPIAGTTQTDQIEDTGVADMGFHYPAIRFTRGDCNGDGGFDIADGIFGLLSLFVSGSESPRCDAACDTNSDGVLDVADPVYALEALFSAGSLPGEPFDECGSGPTPLVCDSYGSCP